MEEVLDYQGKEATQLETSLGKLFNWNENAFFVLNFILFAIGRLEISPSVSDIIYWHQAPVFLLFLTSLLFATKVFFTPWLLRMELLERPSRITIVLGWLGQFFALFFIPVIMFGRLIGVSVTEYAFAHMNVTVKVFGGFFGIGFILMIISLARLRITKNVGGYPIFVKKALAKIYSRLVWILVVFLVLTIITLVKVY